jgi:hypothetical protein
VDNIDNMILSTEKFFIFLNMSKISMVEQELTVGIKTVDSEQKFQNGSGDGHSDVQSATV